MPYLLIDDGMADNPKVLGLTDKAFRLWITMLTYCARNLTDGAISELAIRNSAPNCQLERPLSVVKQLVEAGLFDVTDDGWQVHDYLEYNPSRVEINKKRSLARERKRRQRLNSHADSHAGTHASGHAHQDPQRGSLKRPPLGASPTGSQGKGTIAAGATGTRSTSPPFKDTPPPEELEFAPPPTELLQMFGINKPNVLPDEPDIDQQDAEAIAYYASQDPGFTE